MAPQRSHSDPLCGGGVVDRLGVFALLPAVDALPLESRFCRPSATSAASPSGRTQDESFLQSRGETVYVRGADEKFFTTNAEATNGSTPSPGANSSRSKGPAGGRDRKPYSHGNDKCEARSPLASLKRSPRGTPLDISGLKSPDGKARNGRVLKWLGQVQGSLETAQSQPEVFFLPALDSGRGGPKGPPGLPGRRGGEDAPHRRRRSGIKDMWGKKKMSPRGGAKSAQTLIAALQEKDGHSLTQAVKDRLQKVATEWGVRTCAAGQLPARSFSWDVGAVLDELRLSSQLGAEKFQKLNDRAREMLEDDEERVYTGSYGPMSIRRALKRAVLQNVMQCNPAAFVEESAAEAEAEYRSTAQKARVKLAQLMDEPNSEKVSEEFMSSVHQLRRGRPFFNAPAVVKEMPKRLEVEKKKKGRTTWRVETSIFAQRKKENDSRGWLDSEKTLNKQFSLDWERIVTKSRFRRLVGREDAGVRKEGQNLDNELGEIKDELHAKRDFLRMLFVYYSMYSGYAESSTILQMSRNQWTLFTQECNIVDPKSAGVKPSDLDTMFVSTNFEEDSGTQEAEANDDDALVRFEFLEIIIRASFGKYIAAKILDDSSDSVQKLLDDVIVPHAPTETRIIPNDFRRERMYTREMEVQVKINWDVLGATFKLYKAKDKTKYFWIEHWMALLESVNLLGPHTGLEKRDAKLLFAWSQIAVVDELKRRQRAVSLMLFDFIEALARCADLISPPNNDELDEFYLMDGPPGTSTRVHEYYSRRLASPGCDVQRRESSGLCTMPTRPLHEKFMAFMEVLVEGLKKVWGGSTKEQLVDRMKKVASQLSGGIELG